MSATTQDDSSSEWTRLDMLRGAAKPRIAAAGMSEALEAPRRAPVPHLQPQLPYAIDALEPTICANTVALHYGKHHRSYIDNVNRLIAGTQFAGLSLRQIILSTADRSDHLTLFENAAQAWNHNFYWRSLAPGGDGVLPAALKAKVDASFGYVQALKKELAAAAMAQFGSGWAWLVADRGRLRIMRTANAETPLTTHMTPLLAIDVWEHAYYLDYQDRREAYLEAVLDKLINWNFAAAGLAAI